ncbi:TPA: hypothetical protein DEP21_01310 [Patescibacteria group bacterium]|nr:hypothetical protein [Candidatus Gracilibacteria bacterium]
MQPAVEWLYPSKFYLDATTSSDMDKTNGYDDLKYERSFSEEAKANITKTESDNARVTVEFNAIGKFKVKLTVKDNYGKIGEIEKDVEIKSTLRPEIFVAPIATNRGTPLNFVVKTNEPILNYDWDFADNDKRSIQTDKISHLYGKT